LRQVLAGDLATIVAQTMHKDRNRRYASVNALAEDIRRHRDGRPVLARGDSVAYRTERFVRRRWVPIALGTAVLLAGVGFGVYHTRRVATERDLAQREAHTADAVSEFLISVFLASDPDQFGGKEPTAQDLLARGTERVKTELQDDPTVRARLLDALGEVQRKRGRFADAQPLLEESLALRRATFGDTDPEVIQSLIHVSSLLGDLQDWDGAAALAQEAYDLSAKIHGADDPETVYRLHNLGICLTEQGKLEEAEPILRRSLTERRRLLGNEHTAVAHAVGSLANLMRDLGRYREAADLYAEALELSQTIYGNDHVRVASVWNNLGRMHARLLEYDEAERCCTEALRIRTLVYGEDSVRLIPSIGTLASLRVDQGQYEAAERDYLKTLELSEAAHGDVHEEAISLLTALASAREGMNRFADAESAYVRAISVAERAVGTEHAEWARTAERFGGFLCRRDRPDEALPWIRAALQFSLASYGSDHVRTRSARVALADAHRRLGRSADAREELARSERDVDPVDSESVYERANWALVAARLERGDGNLEAARARYHDSIDALTTFLPPDHHRIREAREELELLGGS
jgi:serine/threonine-protein kinase